MPRKKQPPHTPKPSSTATLALSQLHLRADALEKEHEWLLKQIKRKRTEVNNFVEQMREVATQIFHRGTPVFNKISEIDLEIHAIFDEILSTKKFGKQTQKDILGIYENLQIMGIITPNDRDFDSEDDSELDELFEDHERGDDFSNKSKDNYYQTQPPIPPQNNRSDESKKIRQTFLNLAEIFHPDKVTDSETQMRHTEIMKELNRAYQEGDLAKLLEIEKLHQAGENFGHSTEDDLTRKCNILEQQNSLLENQYKNLKRELKLVKNTPEGALVSDYRQVSKMGIDPMEMFLKQGEENIKVLEKVRDFLQRFRDKKITIKEFLKGPDYMVKMSR